jgi:hypothetical protein
MLNGSGKYVGLDLRLFSKKNMVYGDPMPELNITYNSPYLIESVYQWLARQESHKPMDTALMDTFD